MIPDEIWEARYFAMQEAGIPGSPNEYYGWGTGELIPYPQRRLTCTNTPRAWSTTTTATP